MRNDDTPPADVFAEYMNALITLEETGDAHLAGLMAGRRELPMTPAMLEERLLWLLAEQRKKFK